MQLKKLIFPTVILATVAGIAACSSPSKLQLLEINQMTARLQLPSEMETYVPFLDSIRTNNKKDTIKVEMDGYEMLLMSAVRDEESGEMTAHEVLEAAVVTARFRNVAERHGKVNIEFQIIVPESMQDSKWQLRFYPDLFILEDTVALENVVITGEGYRRAQLKGYQQYEKFLSSIVTDTTKFIDLRNLEIWLSRNIPELYALKNDSTDISDAYMTSIYGVSEQEAVEHYTNKFLRRRNQRRIANKGKMYQKYVKAPIVTEGIRLDTVIRMSNGDYVYNYIQEINTRPRLRKVDVVLKGDIFEQDVKLYRIPETDPLTFYISSVNAFVDNTERYRTKIVERRVDINSVCYVDFEQGKSEVKLDLSNNETEIGRIRENLVTLMNNDEFELDSIVVTASASPEGTLQTNERLSKDRAASISQYFKNWMKVYQDSLERDHGLEIDIDGNWVKYERVNIPFNSRSNGENWDYLDVLVQKDSVMSDDEKELYADIVKHTDNLDERDLKLQREPYYKYLREILYPKMRTVRFDFALHRKGMVQDTVHTTELDSLYMEGVQLIRDFDYEEAIKILGSYKDYNTAVAYVALDRNESAMQILKDCERTPQVNYMLAILYARKGDDQNAVQHYMNACKEDGSYVFRGNLDPEINALIQKYGLNQEDDDDLSMYY